MRISFSLFYFIAIVGSSYGQVGQKTFTNLDVFALEYASDPQISPGGDRVVYVRNSMDIMKDRKVSSLWIVDDDGANHRKLTSREEKETSPRWSPDGSRIAFISTTDEGSEIYVYWVGPGKFARLTQLEKSPSGLSWSPDGKNIAFSMIVPEKPPVLVTPPGAPKGAKWADKPRVTTRLKHEADGTGYIDPGFRHLFIIPSDGGSPRQITSGDFHLDGTPQWARDGKSLIFTSNRNENWEYEFRNSEIYKVGAGDGVVTALTDRNGPDFGAVVSPDGKRIAWLGYDDKVQTYQLTRLYVMNLDGSGKRELKTGLDRSVAALSWANSSTGLYFKYDDRGNTKIGFVTLTDKMTKLADNLGGTSIGRPYGGGSYSVSDKGQIVYTYTTPYHPAELAFLPKAPGEVKLLTGLNDDILPHRRLARVEEVWYKSTVDQRDIQGWIVMPPGFDPQNKYPLMVENHGGPISNYGDRFAAEIQLFAADGYVVFYPNPRGSTGYGEEFGNLLYRNYPGNDYDDVMDGVDVLLEKGYIHRDSLFVTGGSAGGIMTAWMIGKNNRFRAAAVVKPVMNWISKTLVADNYYQYSHYRYPGWPWENMETYMKFSPISLVGNIQTPTLVMVGTADLRTPVSEAKQLYHALKIRKIETAFVEIPGAFHNISAKPSQLIAKVDHVLAWFRKYRKKTN